MLVALRASPHDDIARLVYADWLIERGDPRGELLAFDHGDRHGTLEIASQRRTARSRRGTSLRAVRDRRDRSRRQSWADPQLTVSAWVHASQIEGSIFTHESVNGCPSPELRMGSGTAGLVQLNTSDSTHNNAFTQAGMMTAGAWHQLAVSWDGTTQRVYVDGACACSTQPTLQPLDNPQEVTIGCYPNNGETLTGAIDELRVYDRALGDAEVGLLYTYASGTQPGAGDCSTPCTTAAPL